MIPTRAIPLYALQLREPLALQRMSIRRHIEFEIFPDPRHINLLQIVLCRHIATNIIGVLGQSIER